ncbi:hypothetical protein FNF28_05195 [Cafeteria roenbergensis]|uniref:Importin N-terminal domain-containing protein n=1 Tax=Cafeteria roenbergensis TaxID=33653 RepID=A0A5A8D8R0_CAFRO|nr:hypothetical protein FNF28_05195 [Cafeteria roenbergensis]
MAAVSITTMIESLQSGDNDVRKKAEASFAAALESAPAQVVRSMLEAMASHPDESTRLAAAVFMLQPLETWPRLDEDTRQMVLRVFADRTLNEPVFAVRRRVVNSCMHVARVTSAWPGVVEGAIGALPTASPEHKESLLTLVSRIAEARPEWVIPQAAALAAPAAACLATGNPAPVRAAAAGCISRVASRLEDPAAITGYSAALGPILTATREMASEGAESECREVLSDLTSAIGGMNARLLLKSCAATVVGGAESIAATDSFSDEVRTEAIQVFITACQLAGPQVRSASLHGSLITLCLRLMSRVPEDGVMVPSAFAALPYAPEQLSTSMRDIASLADVAEDALDRVASSFGASLVLTPAMAAISSLVTGSQPWNVRRAAVVAIAVLVNACGRPSAAQGGAGAGGAHAAKGRAQGGFTREQRAAVLAMLVKALSADPDPRVRYEAARSLGRYAEALCDQHTPSARTACREMCSPGGAMTALAAACKPTAGHPLVVCGAAAEAIKHCLSSACPHEAAVERMPELMAALQPLLGTPSASVTAQALETVAAVAAATGDEFSAYYAPLIGPIRSIASSSTVIGTGAEAARVRAAAMVCLGSLVESVSPEEFKADAAATLGPIFEAITAASSGDPAAAAAAGSAGTAPAPASGSAMQLGQAALTAVGRIGSHLGPDFAPFLGPIVPPLLAAASVNVDFSASQAEDEVHPSSGDGKSVVVSLSGVGNVRFQMNTDAVTEKQEALSSLLDLCVSCGAAVGPFAPQIVAVLMAQVSEKFNGVCRALASSALAPCIKAAVEYAQGQGATEAAAVASVAPMLLASITAVAQQARQEVTTDGAPLQMAEALKDLVVVSLVGARDEVHLFTKADTPVLALPKEVVEECVLGSCSAAGMAAERIRVKREDIEHHGHTDAHAIVMMREDLKDEETILRHSIDALGYVIKSARAGVLASFALQAEPVLGPRLVDASNAVLHHAALCSFVDVCEWCGEHAARYVPELTKALGKGMVGEDEDVRQVSCYGVGALAESQPAAIAPLTSVAIPALLSVINRPDARSEENEFATDNAVSALAKLLRHCSEAVGADAPRLWTAWVKALPIRSDETEAFYCHALLAEQVEKGNPFILGEGGSNLPDIVRVCGEVFASAAAASGDGAGSAEASAGEDDEDDEEEEPITMASTETVTSMVGLVRGVAAKLPAAALATMVASMPENVRAALAMATAK